MEVYCKDCRFADAPDVVYGRRYYTGRCKHTETSVKIKSAMDIYKREEKCEVINKDNNCMFFTELSNSERKVPSGWYLNKKKDCETFNFIKKLALSFFGLN